MEILKIKDSQGNWVSVPAIKGEDGANRLAAGDGIEIDRDASTGIAEIAVDYNENFTVNSDQELMLNPDHATISVNSKTGNVVLDATDIEITTNRTSVQANLMRIDGEIGDIPRVSVSGTGTSSTEVNYITVDGNEYKLAGGGGGGGLDYPYVPELQYASEGTKYDLKVATTLTGTETVFYGDCPEDMYNSFYNGKMLEAYKHNAVWNAAGANLFLFDPGQYIEFRGDMAKEFSIDMSDSGSFIFNEGVITLKVSFDGAEYVGKYGYNVDDFHPSSTMSSRHTLFTGFKPGYHIVRIECINNTYDWNLLPEGKTRNDGAVILTGFHYYRLPAIGRRATVYYGSGASQKSRVLDRGYIAPQYNGPDLEYLPGEGDSFYIPLTEVGDHYIDNGDMVDRTYTVRFYNYDTGDYVGLQTGILFKGSYTLPTGYVNKYPESHTVQGNLTVWVVAGT